MLKALEEMPMLMVLELVMPSLDWAVPQMLQESVSGMLRVLEETRMPQVLVLPMLNQALERTAILADSTRSGYTNF